MTTKFISFGLLWLLFACKQQQEPVKERISFGLAEATFNGQTWPEKSAGTFTQVTAQRFRGRCRQTDDQRTASFYTLAIITGKQSTHEHMESVGFTFEPGIYPLTRQLQTETNLRGTNEICELFADQLGTSTFSYSFDDGFDVMPYADYKVNTSRLNTLTITRLDTMEKIIEGSFDASFVQREGLSKTRPDTIRVRCSRFVARLNM